MSWTVSGRPEAAPVWSGTDSIFDPHNMRRCLWWLVKLCGYVVGAPWMLYGVLSGVVASYTIVRRGWWDLELIALCVGVTILSAYSLIWMWRDRADDLELPRGFIRRSWMLRTDGQALVFCAGLFDPELDPLEVSRDGSAWRVMIDDVARVESGLTAEWQPGRRYTSWFGLELHSVPRFEYQTFLFLRDGSRRVIQTVNADREGSAMLAASIRAWLEGHRLVAAPLALALAVEGYEL